MAFNPVYSSNLSTAKIRLIFCRAKFNNRISCNKCGSFHIAKFSHRQFRCQNCWTKQSITTGTWINRTRYPFRFWHEITWCFILGHSANKAHRLLKTPSATQTWYAYQAIRKAILVDSLINKPNFVGTCEVDESYYGGQFKNLRKPVRKAYRQAGLAKRGRGAKYRKQPVFGIYKRNGTVHLDLIKDSSQEELLPKIKKVIAKDSIICSDEHTSYGQLVGLGYVYRVVNHGQQEYVVGQWHVNGIEGFWGLSKTNMHTYKGIRKPNWKYYLKEMEWRYNHRHKKFEQQVLGIIKLLMSKKRPVIIG